MNGERTDAVDFGKNLKAVDRHVTTGCLDSELYLIAIEADERESECRCRS